MKHPYLDLWSYVNSVAPEIYIGERIVHQSWVSLSNVNPEAYALVPNEFIKYFQNITEIEARLGSVTRHFTKAGPWQPSEMSSAIRNPNYHPIISKMPTAVYQLLNSVAGRSNTIDSIRINPSYTFRGNYLSEEKEQLLEMAEELKVIGTRVSCMYNAAQRWGERATGKYHPAPFQIPIVVDNEDRAIVYSSALHAKAERLMRNRLSNRASISRANEILAKFNGMTADLDAILYACPYKGYQNMLIPKLIPKALFIPFEKYGIKVSDLQSSIEDAQIYRIAAHASKIPQNHVIRIFETTAWRKWFKRLNNKIKQYLVLYQKNGSKLLAKNAKKHISALNRALSRGHFDRITTLVYAAKVPGWENIKKVYQMSGLEK